MITPAVEVSFVLVSIIVVTAILWIFLKHYWTFTMDLGNKLVLPIVAVLGLVFGLAVSYTNGDLVTYTSANLPLNFIGYPSVRALTPAVIIAVFAIIIKKVNPLLVIGYLFVFFQGIHEDIFLGLNLLYRQYPEYLYSMTHNVIDLRSELLLVTGLYVDVLAIILIMIYRKKIFANINKRIAIISWVVFAGFIVYFLSTGTYFLLYTPTQDTLASVQDILFCVTFYFTFFYEHGAKPIPSVTESARTTTKTTV